MSSLSNEDIKDELSNHPNSATSHGDLIKIDTAKAFDTISAIFRRNEFAFGFVILHLLFSGFNNYSCMGWRRAILPVEQTSRGSLSWWGVAQERQPFTVPLNSTETGRHGRNFCPRFIAMYVIEDNGVLEILVKVYRPPCLLGDQGGWKVGARLLIYVTV